MPKPPEIPRLIPRIPLPFEEVMRDVLKVKPPEKEKGLNKNNHPKAKEGRKS